MSFTYVIGDIHGRDDLLVAALDEIAARARSHAGVIVALGDYVGKGPRSRQVIERLLPLVSGNRNFVALKGNHDAMMVEALRDPAKLAGWQQKGGDAALASYGGDPAVVPHAHIAWLDQLPLTHLDAHRLYVHAGVEPGVPLDRQSETTLMWKRYPKGNQDGFGDRHVVHGHDNDPEGPLLYPGRSNLDTAAWRTGRLTVGVFDDDRPGGPVDLIEVTGPAG